MSDKPFHNPFGALKGLHADRPAEPAPPPMEARRESPSVKPIPRAVVRLERTGRGGKTVTVIEQLAVTPSELGNWLKALKSALGCGGQVEDGAIVLQGDQRDRVVAQLEARGVKRVIRG